MPEPIDRRSETHLGAGVSFADGVVPTRNPGSTPDLDRDRGCPLVEPSRAGVVSRRRFVRAASAGAAALVGGGLASLLSCSDPPAGPSSGRATRTALRAPTSMSGTGLLTASDGSTAIAPDTSVPAWLYNGVAPGPTVRVRSGESLAIRFANHLPDPSIVHWHGLLVPAGMDGHPRDTIAAGGSFDYRFPIVQRAGTFWYHPHAHHRTAEQVHRGLAGFFLVEDDEEAALHLPTGATEILLMLQDRDGSPALSYAFAPTSSDRVEGVLRDTPFGNGARWPQLAVSGTRYRFRVLNASHARVYLLAMSGVPGVTIIGNDGGLLPHPVVADQIFLGVGERVDLLVDFHDVPLGARPMLRSLPFTLGVGSDAPHPQGMPMDLLELVRVGPTTGAPPPLPGTLSSIPVLGPTISQARTFVFTSSGDGSVHRINGLSFDIDRIDAQVHLGEVERWSFVNDSSLPHPVHVHGTHFQVASRTGGRGMVFPCEGGWKDTVLVMPSERVDVLVRFTEYRGVFLLHCHNLQHEDHGMMLNLEVV